MCIYLVRDQHTLSITKSKSVFMNNSHYRIASIILSEVVHSPKSEFYSIENHFTLLPRVHNGSYIKLFFFRMWQGLE